MILRGYVDGVEVRFDFTPPNKYIATIPKKLDGEYIVQLQAIDEAGNITNYSNVFIRVNSYNVNIVMLQDPYNAVPLAVEFNAIELNSTWNCVDKSDNLLYNILKDTYTFRELVI